MPINKNNSALANQLLAAAAQRKAAEAKKPAGAAPAKAAPTATSAAATSAKAPATGTRPVAEIGRVISVGSAQVIMSVGKQVIRNNLLHLAQLGSVLKIKTRKSLVITMVSSLKVGAEDDEGMSDGCLIQLDIMGEIVENPAFGKAAFYRGVRNYPVLNEAIYTVTSDELRMIFASNTKHTINVGHLQQDSTIGAEVRTDDLLSKHFAIVGSTGSGKSCTVALLLQEILRGHSNAHVVLFDPHNEYSASFGSQANVITSKSLELPLWLFDFEETVELLASDLPSQRREEVEILTMLIMKAKRDFQKDPGASGLEMASVRKSKSIGLNSPSPYRITDLLKLIDGALGRLENSSNLAPYLRLKRRIEMMLQDDRYDFIFRNGPFPNTIQDILGKIFRLPVAGKPISILDFSSIPSDCLNIVVSVVCRLAFDLALWSERKIPILLVCEEAHRYVPNNTDDGFGATRRAIGRIAKEGRKYGVSICLVSQRPSELDPTALSQCSTIFSMRLNNERDQQFVKAAIPDGAGEMLNFLPSLGTAETMVFGESVNLPMRIIMKTLAEEHRPHSSSASFTQTWCKGEIHPAAMDEIFNAWTNGSRDREEDDVTAAPAAPAPNAAPNGAPASSRLASSPLLKKNQPGAAPARGQMPAPAAPAPATKESSYDALRRKLAGG